MSSRDVDESLPLLASPAGGVPDLIDTPDALADAAEALRAGTGAVGVDAERASGIRYGNRAFLIQLNRAGAGTLLIDPEALPDLGVIDRALSGVEWILHASTQDLPCLAEKGMTPDVLFDTELAAKMLGFERFGLAAVVAETTGMRLAKEHSNVDWSTRPLPHDWLNYAALDVELLDAVRADLQHRLDESGKAEFARQEFEHLLGFTPAVYAEPWRRVHGAGAVKTRRGLARLAAMWTFRDRIAARQDLAPGRIIRDRALVELVGARIRTPEDLQRNHAAASLPKSARHGLFKAITDADALPDSRLPARRSPDSAPGPEVDREEVKARLAVMKPAISEAAAELTMPHEVLLSPRIVKALAGRKRIGDAGDVAAYLAGAGARPWQIEKTAEVLADAAENAEEKAPENAAEKAPEGVVRTPVTPPGSSSSRPA